MLLLRKNRQISLRSSVRLSVVTNLGPSFISFVHCMMTFFTSLRVPPPILVRKRRAEFDLTTSFHNITGFQVAIYRNFINAINALGSSVFSNVSLTRQSQHLCQHFAIHYFRSIITDLEMVLIDEDFLLSHHPIVRIIWWQFCFFNTFFSASDLVNKTSHEGKMSAKEEVILHTPRWV